MFYGQNRHAIDPKGRIIFPSKYREELGEYFYITRGLSNCLFVYPENEWKKLEEKLRSLPMSSAGNIQRFFFNNTEKVSCDKQGRVLLASHLKDYAKLKKDIVIAGVSNRLEIWDAEEFDGMNSLDNMNVEEITSQMEILGL
ncbi:MAG: division/cell wall cluster transcriptional repressor MraZ [Clostridia bacterium]|nr:division/cell wall cluster transcriptional repressor MraZ [Oscillospiraceae bacterium]MBR4892924.1 division/cell wall cluster transcriptional repressor MraZ [Clostridia bacterium]